MCVVVVVKSHGQSEDCVRLFAGNLGANQRCHAWGREVVLCIAQCLQNGPAIVFAAAWNIEVASEVIVLHWGVGRTQHGCRQDHMCTAVSHRSARERRQHAPGPTMTEDKSAQKHFVAVGTIATQPS